MAGYLEHDTVKRIFMYLKLYYKRIKKKIFFLIFEIYLNKLYKRISCDIVIFVTNIYHRCLFVFFGGEFF